MDLGEKQSVVPEEGTRSRTIFDAVWDVIKGWDVQRSAGQGYASANGSDAEAITIAVESALDQPELPTPDDKGDSSGSRPSRRTCLDLAYLQLYERLSADPGPSSTVLAEVISILHR